MLGLAGFLRIYCSDWSLGCQRATEIVKVWIILVSRIALLLCSTSLDIVKKVNPKYGTSTVCEGNVCALKEIRYTNRKKINGMSSVNSINSVA